MERLFVDLSCFRPALDQTDDAAVADRHDELVHGGVLGQGEDVAGLDLAVVGVLELLRDLDRLLAGEPTVFEPLAIPAGTQTGEVIRLRGQGVPYLRRSGRGDQLIVLTVAIFPLLGIGGIVTFKNSGLDEVVRQVDLKHIVLETDSPYLAPVPMRGKRNESTYISLVAEKLAEVKAMAVDDIAETTTRTAKALFNL